MTQQNKNATPPGNKPSIPRSDQTVKQEQREKAETKEVAGKHKNDGQKDHKGRR